MNNNPINKWCITHVVMQFEKLKGAVKTESGKKSITAGEWFMPLSNKCKFKWMAISTPKELFTIATDEEIKEHFSSNQLEIQNP